MPTPELRSAPQSLAAEVAHLAQETALAAPRLARLKRQAKDEVLLDLALRLEANQEQILEENELDLVQARQAGATAAFIDRLTLTPEIIGGLARSLEEVAGLDDPVGRIESLRLRPNGLQVGRMRVLLGVIGFIYESRPNVTVEAAGLCFKSGNAVILKGGSEALRSNLALGRLIQESLAGKGLPRAAVQVVPFNERAATAELLREDRFIDLIIPRGGEGLIRLVAEQAKMPVLKHYKGVCHLFVDDRADLEMALELTLNGKVQRPGVCNALETLLCHRAVAGRFLPQVDASCVLVNASTRLNDGGQLGLGAETGISTDKLHAYGPMGLKELTTTKFIAHGQGQVRE